GVVACSPSEPQKPVKLAGNFSGSFNSPRFAMKMRSGVSAKTPPVEPQMEPLSGSGCGHPAAALQRPVLSPPPFACAETEAERHPKRRIAIRDTVHVRMATCFHGEVVWSETGRILYSSRATSQLL